MRCGTPSFRVPAVEERQLVEEDERLDRVEPRSVALEVVTVLPPLAVLAERAYGVGEAGVVGHDRSGVTPGAEVLRRVEAERGGEPGRSGPDVLPLGTVRLAGVLDEREPAPVG